MHLFQSCRSTSEMGTWLCLKDSQPLPAASMLKPTKTVLRFTSITGARTSVFTVRTSGWKALALGEPCLRCQETFSGFADWMNSTNFNYEFSQPIFFWNLSCFGTIVFLTIINKIIKRAKMKRKHQALALKPFFSHDGTKTISGSNKIQKQR